MRIVLRLRDYSIPPERQRNELYKVYYTDPDDNECYSWDEKNLTSALSISEQMRRHGMVYVTIVSENPDSIGKSGVDAVVDGKLPNGLEYTWKKRRR